MQWQPSFTRPYLVLLATMAAAKLAVSALGIGGKIASQNLALAWPTLIVLGALGWGALFLAERVGFADRWARAGSPVRWYALVVLAGFAYGVVSASGDIAMVAGNAKNDLEAVWGTAEVHQTFPASLPFYYYGAVFLEIFLRLVGLTLFTWLFGLVPPGRRRPELAFWAAAALVSLYEPWPYVMHDLVTLPPAAWPEAIVARVLDPLFVANVFTCYLFRRRGVWSAVIFRWSYYLIWHVAYGGFRGSWLSLVLHR